MDTASELKKIISGNVRVDEKALDEHSRDASLFVVKPQVVVYPKGVDDVKALVRFINEHKSSGLSLTARAAGTDMSGGPLSESIVVSFMKYFTSVQSVDPKSKTAVTEPGVFYRNFEKETMKHNLQMPSYPASRELCAMGGIVNNNSGGEKTLEYGKTIDYVDRMNVVLSDGNAYKLEPLNTHQLKEKMKQNNFEGDMYRKTYELIEKNWEVIQKARPTVSKNSAGYNLWEIWDKDKKTFNLTKLFVGAQGTLGFVTDAEIKLVHPHPHSKMVVVFVDDLKELGNLVNTALSFKPSTFESYDDKTLKLAVKFFPAFVKRLGLIKTLSIGLNSLPELISIIKKGLPKLVLQITLDGDNNSDLQERAQKLVDALKQYKPRHTKIIKNSKQAESYWMVRRESFSLLRNKVKDRKTAPFVDDIVVNPEHYPEFLPRLEKLFEPYKDMIIYTVAGHIGNGNFHIIPLMKLEEEEQRNIIPDLSHKVYDLVLEYSGSITGEHNDGLIRSPYLKQMFGKDVYKLFEEIKDIFDPNHIFNPGKKVGSNLQYALDHIRKD